MTGNGVLFRGVNIIVLAMNKFETNQGKSTFAGNKVIDIQKIEEKAS